MQEQDIAFMKRCLELAEMGRYTAAPNPMVGSIVVHEGQIIGEGFHHHAGGPHAEVMAIESVKNKELLNNSTIYVSLEPCSHYGRTPPCSDLIIDSKIPRVKIATRDFNTQVNGAGIAKLQSAGIDVEEGILEKEAQELNSPFFKFHRTQTPYVTLKWAQTRDGIMDPKREKNAKGVQWISAPESQVFAHKLRAQNQAILVGRKTVEVDDPSLDARAFSGRDPLRLIIDPERVLDKTKKVFRDSNYYCFSYKPEGANDVLLLKGEDIIEQILDFCYEHNIQSILVEGGSYTLGSFIDIDAWDEAYIIEAQQNLLEGLLAPSLAQKAEIMNLGMDQLKHYRK